MESISSAATEGWPIPTGSGKAESIWFPSLQHPLSLTAPALLATFLSLYKEKQLFQADPGHSGVGEGFFGSFLGGFFLGF